MEFSTGMIVSSFVILVFGLLHLWGAYSNKKWLFYLFKPVTTLSIAAMCYYLAPELNNYVYLILLGLVLSTLGDIFLMLPKDRFVPGLVSFLLAHIAYIIAFAGSFDVTYSWLLILPLVILACVIMRVLWPHLGDMSIPVVVYMSIIVSMAWLSAERYLSFADTASLFACVGAFVFLFSDATLAFDRFKKQFHRGYAFIIISYYIAQYFIALSVI
ncbi:MAG: putative membrane protein YhhN [Moritella sp.]|jgi:uncharacterized membrane protein YhhN